jgi:hypothetical protein
MTLRTSGAAVLLASLLAWIGGCNGNGLVSAGGRLTYKGQPVPSTRVYFWPEDGSRRSSGLTDDDGKFQLKFAHETGVKLGKHKVVVKYEVSAEEEVGEIPPKASRELRKVIGKYSDPKTSPLRYEVTHSGQVFEIALE